MEFKQRVIIEQNLETLMRFVVRLSTWKMVCSWKGLVWVWRVLEPTWEMVRRLPLLMVTWSVPWYGRVWERLLLLERWWVAPVSKNQESSGECVAIIAFLLLWIELLNGYSGLLECKVFWWLKMNIKSMVARDHYMTILATKLVLWSITILINLSSASWTSFALRLWRSMLIVGKEVGFSCLISSWRGYIGFVWEAKLAEMGSSTVTVFWTWSLCS